MTNSDSLLTVALSAELSDDLQVEVPVDLLFVDASFGAVCEAVAGAARLSHEACCERKRHHHDGWERGRGGRGTPARAGVEVREQYCNIACTYCLTESGPKVAHRALSADMMLEVGRQAKELGFTDLGVTGGETFGQPHLPEVLAQLADLLPTVALTNATLFSRRLLDRVTPLAGRDIALQISLDRPDADVNDEMRAPQNFAKVVTAIPALVQRGIKVRIATTVESIEDAELDRLCALHRDLGVPDSEHIIRPIVRRGRAQTHGFGVDAAQSDLPAELTITDDGAFWGPFGPTVNGGKLDTDLLITRSTLPLSVPAEALLGLVENRPQGADSTLNIR